MSNSFVKLDKDANGVATVVLARAQKHNAFDEHIIAELREIFLTLDEDESVRAVVLAAKGKSFSAGADLNWMRRMAGYNYNDNLYDARALADMLAALNTLRHPTIARVQGPAYGGAVGLVACCDIAFATPAATFCLSEVKLGLIPAVISPYVIEAIGQRASRRYFQTAEVFSAATAQHLGLVTEVYDDTLLDNAVSTCVNNLLVNGPVAMREAKALIFDVSNKAIDEHVIHHTSDRIASIRVSEEGQEGLTAFLEKRSPNWRSKNNV